MNESERGRWNALTEEERSLDSIFDLISTNNDARQRIFDECTNYVLTHRRVTRKMEMAAQIVMRCFKKGKNFQYIYMPIREALDRDPAVASDEAFRRWVQTTDATYTRRVARLRR